MRASNTRAIRLCLVVLLAALMTGGCRLFIGVPKTGWELVGPKAFTAGTQYSGDVVIRTMADGNPAIAYSQMNSGASTALYVQFWNGSAWTMAGSNPLTTSLAGMGGGSGIFLTCDAQGILVGYSEWGQTTFQARRFSDTSWSTVATVDLGSTGTPQVEDMAEDGSGKLSLIVQTGSSPNCQHVLYIQSGSTFVVASTDPAAYDFSEDMHLSFDSVGTAYVSFSTYSSASGSMLTVTTLDGAAWKDIGPGTAAAQNPTRVAFDSTGTPYIVFSAESVNSFFNPVVLRYTGAGTAWTQVGTSPVSASTQTSDYCLELHGDVPFVALEEDLGYSEISVLRCDGAAWTPVGRRGFSDGRAGEMPSLTLDANGVPSVALIEVGNEKKISVYRYAGNEN